MTVVGDEEAVAPVLAALLLVAVAVTTSAVVYVVATDHATGADAPAEIGFTERTGSCLSLFHVAAVRDASWNDLEIRVDGADRYAVQAAGHLADDQTWTGDALGEDRPVEDGDVLRVGIADDVDAARLTVVDRASETVVYRDAFDVVADDDDPTGSIALDDGATVHDLDTLSGSADDGCSGAATTQVTIQDASGAYLSPDGFQDDPHIYDADGSDWTADVDDDRLDEGDYTVTATPVDRAGRTGEPRTVDVTFDPDPPVFDPGHAYEDVDNDGAYDADVDVKIPDSAVLDGEYVTPNASNGLVLPPSLGDVAASRITYHAGADGHLIVDVDLSSTDERIDLEGGTSANVSGIDVRSDDEHVNVTAGTWIAASGADLESAHEDVDLDAGGHVDVAEATLTSGDQRVEIDADGVLAANGTTMVAAERVDLAADGDIWIESAHLEAEKVLLDAAETGNAIHVAEADLVTAEEAADADPDCVAVDGTPATGSVDDGC